MAAGFGIALDTSGRTDNRLGDKLEETFEDVDVLGFEKTRYSEILSSEDSTVNISYDNNFLTEEVQLFLRLAALREEAFHVFPSEEEVLANGGDLYTWSYDDLKHCPVLRKTVSDTVMLLEAGDKSCNKKKSSKPNVKRKLGQISAQTVASEPVKIHDPVTIRGGGGGGGAFHHQESINGGQKYSKDVNIDSSGYWSTGTPKSDAAEIHNDSVTRQMQFKSSCWDDTRNLIEKNLTHSDLRPDNAEGTRVGKVSQSNETTNSQTVNSVTRFQNYLHSISGENELRQSSTDSLKQNASPQNGSTAPIAGYLTPHNLAGSETNVFKPLKSSSSMPTMNSKSSLDSYTLSQSNFSETTSSLYQNPPVQSFRKNMKCAQSEAVRDDSIEFLPLEDSTSQLDCLETKCKMDTAHRIINDTSADIRPCRHKAMLTIGSPPYLMTPYQSEISSSTNGSRNVSPSQYSSRGFPSGNNSCDSLSAALSPGLRTFLQTSPPPKNYKSHDSHKCFTDVSNSRADISDLISPRLRGFLSPNLPPHAPNPVTQEAVAGLPEDIHLFHVKKFCNTSPAHHDTEVDNETLKAKSNSDLSLTKLCYSPWSHVTTRTDPLPPDNVAKDASTAAENTTAKSLNLSANSQTNIAGVRYEGRLKMPGVTMNDSLPFQKTTTQTTPKIAGVSVLTPQLPIAGFDYGFSESSSSSSTITSSNPSVLYDNSINSDTDVEIERSIGQERMARDSISIGESLSLGSVSIHLEQTAEDRLAENADCLLGGDLNLDVVLTAPLPSMDVNPVVSVTSLEQVSQ